MSITIATQNRRFTVKTSDMDSERLFNNLVRQLLEIESADIEPIPYVLADEHTQNEVVVSESDTTELPGDLEEHPIQEPELPRELGQGYSGFLYIKCEHCGNAHAFCPKHKITSYKCSDCGAETILQDMTPMYTHCECGKRSRYLTNMDEFAFDVSCISCGAPVAVKYNDRKGIYETIK